jgi:hypothetical protein
MLKRTLGAIAATLTFIAPAAEAATVNVTFSGVVESGYDEFGTYGTANADLAGLAYSASFTYDTGLGARNTAPGQYDQVIGGTWAGGTTPVQSMAVTISGVTTVWTAASYGFVSSINYAALYGDPLQPLQYQVAGYHDYTDALTGDIISLHAFDTVEDTGPGAVLVDIDNPQTTINNILYPNGHISLTRYDPLTGIYSQNVSAVLHANGAAVVTVAPVPLPAAGGLMIVALGGVAALRRRKAPQDIAA